MMLLVDTTVTTIAGVVKVAQSLQHPHLPGITIQALQVQKSGQDRASQKIIVVLEAIQDVKTAFLKKTKGHFF